MVVVDDYILLAFVDLHLKYTFLGVPPVRFAPAHAELGKSVTIQSLVCSG